MNKYFSKVTSLLLAGVMVFAAGCTDFSQDINDIQDTIGAVDPNAPSLVEQLQALKDADATLKAALEAAEANAKALYATKEELTAAKGELNTAIAALQTKDNELAEALSKAVKDANNAIAALEGKHNQDVETLRGEIASSLETAKGLLDAQSKKIDSLIEAFQGVKSDYEGFKSETLNTLKEMKAEYASLVSSLETTLTQLINDGDKVNADAIAANALLIADNATAIAALEAKHDTQLTDIKATITALEDKLTAAIAENTKSIETLTTVTIPEIENRLNETDLLITALQRADANLEEALAEYQYVTDANLDALKVAIEEINKVLLNHGAQIGENTAEIEKIWDAVNVMDADHKRLLDEMKADYTNLYNTLKKEMEDYVAFHALWMQGQLDNIKADYDAKIEALKEELLKKIEEGDKANEALISDNAAAIAKNAAAIDGLVKDLEGAVDEYTKLVSSLQSQITDLGKVDMDLEQSINAAIDEYTKLISSLQSQITDLGKVDMDHEDALNAAIDEYTKLVASLQSQITDLGKVDMDHEDELETLRADLDALEAGLDAAVAVLDQALADAISVLEGADELLAEGIREIRSTLNMHKDEIKKNATAIAANLQSIEALQALTNKHESEITVLQDQVNLLEAEAKRIGDLAWENRSKINELDKKIDEAIASINETTDDLAGDIADLQEQIDALVVSGGNVEESTLKQLSELRNIVEENYNAMLAYVNTINTNIALLGGELNDLKNTVEIYKNGFDAKIKDILDQLENLDNKIDGVNDQVQINKEAIAHIVNMVQSLVYVPEYTDGAITANYAEYSVTVQGDDDAMELATNYLEGQTHITYAVQPAELADELATAWMSDRSIFSYNVKEVKTRAAAQPEFNIIAVYPGDEYGTIEFIVEPRNLGVEFYRGNDNYAVALQLGFMDTQLSTVYTNVVPGHGDALHLIPVIVAPDKDNNLVEVNGKVIEDEVTYAQTDIVKTLAAGHQVRFADYSAGDAYYWTVEELQYSGYVVPAIYPSNEDNIIVPADSDEEFDLYSILNTNPVEENGYQYMTVQLKEPAENNTKAVGYAYQWIYTYTIDGSEGVSTLSTTGQLNITKEQYSLEMKPVDIYWNYHYHAEADMLNMDNSSTEAAQKYQYNDPRVYSLEILNRDNLPEYISVDELFKLKNNNNQDNGNTTYEVAPLEGGEFKADKYNYRVVIDNKGDGKNVITQAWLNRRTADFDPWDKTVKATVKYSVLPYAEITLVLNFNFIDRPDVIDVDLEPVTKKLTKEFAINHGDENTTDNLVESKIVTEMYNHIPAFEPAKYLEDLFVNHTNKSFEGTIENVNDAAQKVTMDKNADGNGPNEGSTNNIKLTADALTATMGYKQTANMIDLGTELVYKATYTTWFGQVINLTKTVTLDTPDYKFDHFNYRVNQEGNIFFTDVEPLYNPGYDSPAVTAFSVADVKVAEAFNIVDENGADVDAAAKGIVPVFEFKDPASVGEGIEINDNVITYNGSDNQVLVNGKLFQTSSVAGHNWEIPNAFAAYLDNYEVRKYDPIGELGYALPESERNMDVKDAKKYTVNMFSLFTLEDARGWQLIENGAWLDGNGENGYGFYKSGNAVNVEAVYDLDYSFNVTIPYTEYKDVITFDNATGILTFDNTDQLALYRDIDINVELVVASKWGEKKLPVKFTFNANR